MPGGRPWGSISRQYSHRSTAIWRMPCKLREQERFREGGGQKGHGCRQQSQGRRLSIAPVGHSERLMTGIRGSAAVQAPFIHGRSRRPVSLYCSGNSEQMKHLSLLCHTMRLDGIKLNHRHPPGGTFSLMASAASRPHLGGVVQDLGGAPGCLNPVAQVLSVLICEPLTFHT